MAAFPSGVQEEGVLRVGPVSHHQVGGTAPPRLPSLTLVVEPGAGRDWVWAKLILLKSTQHFRAGSGVPKRG